MAPRRPSDGRTRRPNGAKLRLAPGFSGHRAGAHLVVAGGQRLYAPTLEELAEIAQCASRVGDPIELLVARTARSRGLLRDDEFAHFLRLLAGVAT